MLGPTTANQKGQFENREIIDKVEKPYLRSIGKDPLGQYPLPYLFELNEDPSRRTRVLSIIHEQGYKDGPWYFKDAKACLTFTVWEYAFPKAKWVFVRRSREDIISSCQNTSFMRRGIDWQAWIDTHLKRLEDMHLMGLNVTEFWPERVIKGDIDYAKDLVARLGLQWNLPAISRFITPSLWHYNREKAA